MTTLSLSNLPASINRKAKESAIDVHAYRYDSTDGRWSIAIHGTCEADVRRTLSYVIRYASKLDMQVDHAAWLGGVFVIRLVDQGC